MNFYLCVNNFLDMLALTVGHIYTSTKETEHFIWVVNDKGYEEGYSRVNYFRKVEFVDSDNKDFQMKDIETGEILAHLTKK